MNKMHLLVAAVAFLVAAGAAQAGALNVTAQAAATLAKVGNADPLYLVVSVTDATGAPVVGLQLANFSQFPVIVAAQGSVTSIRTITGGQPGVYNLHLIPRNTTTWKAGTYVFSVAINGPAGRGQTLAKIQLP